MNKMVKIQMYILAVVMCCAPAFSQTMSVNGALNPNGIPDENAYTSIFNEMTANTQISETDKIALIGFTEPSDASAFQSQMDAYRSQALGAQTGADLLALGNRFYGQVRNALTSDGWTQLQTFVDVKKSNMAMWTYVGGCGTGTTTTLFDVFFQNYGTTGSDSEFFGDGYDAGNCSCNYNPTGVSVSYNGIVTNGTVTRSQATVSKAVLNGATTEFSTTGIEQPTFTFGFQNSCNGAVYHVGVTTQDEIAYTKFGNIGMLNGGSCVKDAGGFLVCSYAVVPLCSNTTSPDYKYPNMSGPPAYIRDYYYAAWRSVGACSRLIWGSPQHATTWICGPIWPFNVGTGDVSSGVCSYHPPF
jgi:hypothetical protein